MQAGLAIIASNTTAQAGILNQYPDIGLLFNKDDKASLAFVLSYYHQHRENLIAARRSALTVAQTKLNWEIESLIFLNAVNKSLAV